ncbi:MAG: tRNA lysidine(34) synthetase TilS [Clostridiales bacterium]|nr:tRNA lysidine(34) synthetase TilS [Clostridiales bacterium]
MSRVIPGMRMCNTVADLIAVVENYIEKHRLLPAELLVTGVSGGADSMALLFVLKDICARKYPDTKIVCAHVNHGIREEADHDEKTVEDFCQSLGIPFFVKHVRIPEIAKEQGLSLETAGRLERYAFFREIAGEKGVIAVAHHLEDQAESVAMHIFRGAGMEGLCGIRPRNGNIIHPFLCLHKSEICDWATSEGIPYCHDITNDDPSYDRNFWRHEVFPRISDGTGRDPVSALTGLAERVSEESAWLDGLAEEKLEEALEKSGSDMQSSMDGPAVPVEELAAMARPLRRRVLRLLAIRTWGDVVDIEECHWDAILNLTETVVGRGHLDLPGRRTADKERGYFRFLPVGEGAPAKEGGYVDGAGFLTPEGTHLQEVSLRDLRWDEIYDLLAEQDDGKKVNFSQRFAQIRLRRIEKRTPLIYNNLTWFFPESALEGAVLRTRKAGDTFSRAGSGCTKQLRRYMNEIGIPMRYRDRVVLAADGEKVLWIPGTAHAEGFTDAVSEERYRTSQEGAVMEKTERESGNHGVSEQKDGEVLLCLEILPSDNK